MRGLPGDTEIFYICQIIVPLRVQLAQHCELVAFKKFQGATLASFVYKNSKVLFFGYLLLSGTLVGQYVCKNFSAESFSEEHYISQRILYQKSSFALNHLLCIFPENHVPCRILLNKIMYLAGSLFNKSCVPFPYRIFIQKNMFCARFSSRKTHPIQDLPLKKHISETVFSQRISNSKIKKFGELNSREGSFVEQNQTQKIKQSSYQVSIFCIYFWRARICWPLLCLCRPFCVFERCLDSNPTSCRLAAVASRRATNLATQLPVDTVY